MKVLRSTPTFYPHVTGPAYQAYRISKGLEERGHKSPIVTTDFVPNNEEPGYPPDMEQDDDFPFRIIRRQHLFSIDQYRLPPQTLFDYFSESPDIVHCHSYHNAIKDIFYLGNLIDSIPFVIHGHGSFSKSRDPTIERSFQFDLYNKLWYRTVKRADAVVVSSEQERQDAIDFGVSDKKIHKIPVGKEPSVYTSIARHPPKDCIRMLFVGRLAPRRNLEVAIRALASLERDDVDLRIVGGESTLSNSSRSDYLPELKQLVEELGVSSSVTFTGPKYGEDLVREYRNAHFLVNPSHYENFGQVVLEAAFAGLPILSTPTGVALDLIEESKTGYFFKNEDELVEAINKLLDNKLEKMGETISAQAEANYTWDIILNQYISLYKNLGR